MKKPTLPSAEIGFMTGHNSGAMEMTQESQNNANERLRAFVERIERMNDESQAIKDDIKEIYSEAKSTGYDVKALRKVIAERKKDADAKAEQDAIFQTYWDAL